MTKITMLLLALVLGAETVSAQERPVSPPARLRIFTAGAWYVSPRVLLASVTGSSTSYGLSLERALGVKTDEGDVWGVSVELEHHSFTTEYKSGAIRESTTTKETPIGLMAIYHFVLVFDNPRVDPYLGAGPGYSIVRVSVNTGTGDVGIQRKGGMFLQGQAGVRYFLTERLALGAQAGVGISNVGVTATFRF